MGGCWGGEGTGKNLTGSEQQAGGFACSVMLQAFTLNRLPKLVRKFLSIFWSALKSKSKATS